MLKRLRRLVLFVAAVIFGLFVLAGIAISVGIPITLLTGARLLQAEV